MEEVHWRRSSSSAVCLTEETILDLAKKDVCITEPEDL